MHTSAASPRGRPAPTPRVIGVRGTVLFAKDGQGRVALDGDVWDIRYPNTTRLHAGERVHVVGQRADVLLVLPAETAAATLHRNRSDERDR